MDHYQFLTIIMQILSLQLDIDLLTHNDNNGVRLQFGIHTQRRTFVSAAPPPPPANATASPPAAALSQTFDLNDFQYFKFLR
jgi:hypothetical protein